MDRSFSPATVRLLQTISRVIAIVTASVSVVVLAGWQLNIVRIETVLPGLATMKPNTAFGLCFAAAGLYFALVNQSAVPMADSKLRARRCLYLSNSFGGLAALIGLLTLFEHVTGHELGIDGIFFGAQLQAGGAVHPGQMSVSTALCLFCLGSGVLWLDAPRGRWLTQVFAIVAAVLALVGVAGYMYGSKSLYEVGPYRSMALHTALSVFALGSAILMARPRRGVMSVVASDSVGGELARRMVPPALFVPLLLGWIRLRGQEVGLYDTRFGIALYAVSTVIVFLILTFWTANVLLRTDVRRKVAEHELKEERDALDARVAERTAELSKINDSLRTEIHERKQVEAALRLSEERYRAVEEGSMDAFYLLRCVRDAGGQIIDFQYVDVNSRAARRLDMAREAIVGHRLTELFPKAVQAGHLEMYREVIDTGLPLEKEMENNTAAGVKWVLMQLVPVGDEIAITSRDITQRKIAEAEALDMNVRLQGQVEALHRRTREMQIVGEMAELLQMCQSLAEADSVLNVFFPRLFPDSSGALAVMKASQDRVETVLSWGENCGSIPVFGPDECWALRLGRTFLSSLEGAELKCSHVRDGHMQYMCVPLSAQRNMLGILYITADTIPESDQHLARTVADQVSLALANLNLQEKLRNESIRDPLTGLFNRRYLEESLDRELSRADRGGLHTGVIMFDIDHFKRFNDTYGHDAGDAVLQRVGELAQQLTRKSDIACRFGGEEFVIILPDILVEDGLVKAEQLRAEVEQLSLMHDGQSLGVVTISAGVVVPEYGASRTEILKLADSALYLAKGRGRNRVVSANVAETVTEVR